VLILYKISVIDQPCRDKETVFNKAEAQSAAAGKRM